jgi:hypothetical protein
MADSLFKLVSSKVDPISFIGGAPSDTKVDPYTIPLKSAAQTVATPSSSSPSPVFGGSPKQGSTSLLFQGGETAGFDQDGPDLASFLLEAYTLSAVTSPMVVVETLSEIQYHRAESDEVSVIRISCQIIGNSPLMPLMIK